MDNFFYIGVTGQELKIRRENHMSDFRGQSEKIKVIRKAKKENKKIIIRLIELCSKETSYKREIFWIKFYRKQNIELTNEKLGVFHTGDFKEKISKIHKGRKISQETRRKMKDAQMNKRKSVYVDGNIYESLHQASAEIGLSVGFICDVCQEKKKYAHKIIRYA